MFPSLTVRSITRDRDNQDLVEVLCVQGNIGGEIEFPLKLIRSQWEFFERHIIQRDSFTIEAALVKIIVSSDRILTITYPGHRMKIMYRLNPDLNEILIQMAQTVTRMTRS